MSSLARSVPVLLVALLSLVPPVFSATPDLAKIEAQVAKQHDEGVRRLQEWIRLPSIAAQDLGFPAGPEHLVELLLDVGFQKAVIVETDGKPGVFATLDAGAPRTVGLYFMYDVKQFDPSEWSSPPLEAALIEKPGFGTVVMGRGAVNQKGPEMTCLEAIRAIRDSGHRTSVRSCAGPRSSRRCPRRSACTCRPPVSHRTAL
jgi:acetylornithine deacetylase/succinyl-diaminopimelate desuccinylase-like protein